jgi:hypothetical protein
VAQRDSLEKPSDLWSVLDNQQRPGIVFVATLAFNPFAPIETPLTRTAEVTFGPSDNPEAGRQNVSIRGHVRSRKPLEGLRIVLVERGLEAEIRPGGEFGLLNLQPGAYTLEVTATGYRPKRHPITVPSPSYDVDF